MAGKTIASKTGQVRYNVPGATGPIGPLVYPAGEYDAATKYIRTALSAPMVLDDGQYYVLNKEGAFTGIRPKDDYAQNGSNATWVLMEYVKYAFVEVLMANFAKLASAVFYGDVMMSQQGIDADGNESSSYQNYGKKRYDPDTGQSADLFTPNLLLNFLTGLFKGNKIEVEEGIIKGSLMMPFSFVSGSSFPLIGYKGASGVYVVTSAYFEIVHDSIDTLIKDVNGLRFSIQVRIKALDPGTEWSGDRFGISFGIETTGDTTWPSCIIANGISTQGKILGVRKSCVLDLMYVPKIISSSGKIHKVADLCVMNYDSSYMTITNWSDSKFSVTPPESDIVDL